LALTKTEMALTKKS